MPSLATSQLETRIKYSAAFLMIVCNDNCLHVMCPSDLREHLCRAHLLASILPLLKTRKIVPWATKSNQILMLLSVKTHLEECTTRYLGFKCFSVTLWLKAVSAQTSLISCHNCDWGDNLVYFDPFVFVTFVILVS